MKQKLIVLLVLVMFVLGGVPGWGIDRLAVQTASAQGANVIQLTEPGRILVTIQQQGAGCTGVAGLSLPGPEEVLFTDYKNQVGESRLVDRVFPDNTSLEFFIRPGDWCSSVKGANANSSNTERALVTLISPNTWRIEWEDLPSTHKNYDADFNDLILIVRLANQVSDYKQNDPAWADEAYDHLPGMTIGEMGSALAAGASILAYHGGVNDSTNPDSRVPLTVDALNACLAADSTGGYFNGSVRWDRLGWCSDATHMTPPILARWMGKLGAGDAQGNDAAGLRAAAVASLNRGMPVIFEVPHPDNPGGMVYLVGKDYDETTQTFAVNNPYCAAWSGTDCTDPAQTLGPSDAVNGLVLFETQGAREQKVLLLNAPADVHFLVTAPDGSRTGSNGTQSFAEIPDSNYYLQNPPAVQPGGAMAQAQEAMNELYILNPQTGVYTVTVHGGNVGGSSLRGDYQYAPLLSSTRAVGLEGNGEGHTLFVLRNSIAWDQIDLYLPAVVR